MYRHTRTYNRFIRQGACNPTPQAQNLPPNPCASWYGFLVWEGISWADYRQW